MPNNKNLRVDLPKSAVGKLALAALIAQKHHVDATNSVLLYLQDTDWNTLAIKNTEAQILHTTAETAKQQSAAFTEQRNINFKQINHIVRASRDLLLGAFAKNQRALSDWGFNISEAANSSVKLRKYRVEISRNPDELLKLANKIYAKHIADGNSSILTHLIDYKWSTIGPLLLPTGNFNDNAIKYAKDAEKAYEARDIIIAELDIAIKATRTYLLGIYKNTPKTLGDWGFIVNDSAH